MSQARQRSASRSKADRSFLAGSPCRRRQRKRKYPVPRQALGLDFFQLHQVGEVGIVTVATTSSHSMPPLPVPSPTGVAADSFSEAAAIAQEELDLGSNRLRGTCRRALWACVIVLGVILFRDWIVRFLVEAPFAWPSINGEV